MPPQPPKLQARMGAVFVHVGGTDSLGGLALKGGALDKLTSDAAASLTAITIERVRSFEKETRAKASRQSERRRCGRRGRACRWSRR